MDGGIKRLLEVMIGRHYIGGKHFPEKRLLRMASYHIDDKRQFESQYRRLLNDWIIIRAMKRTGKQYDCHISINPRRIKEVKEIIGGKNEEQSRGSV
jgi:hypothetical protein